MCSIFYSKQKPFYKAFASGDALGRSPEGPERGQDTMPFQKTADRCNRQRRQPAIFWNDTALRPACPFPK
jgi:hypothetical protein